MIGDRTILDWVSGLAASGALVTSVCTGSLVLADAGLLDGGPATTHWAALDILAALGDSIEVRPEDRFVDRGRARSGATSSTTRSLRSDQAVAVAAARRASSCSRVGRVRMNQTP